jgi:fumarylacetoacetate (FAA) hydrolase
MKLATLRNGTRDGELAIVSRDLTKAVRAADTIAGLGTMQQLLDDWDTYVLAAERISAELDAATANDGASRLPIIAFEARHAMAPLPRAYQWADGSAYINHVELARKARGAEIPASFHTDPLMYQGCSDVFIGAMEPVPVADEASGIDLEGELAVIVGDTPMGTTPADALEHVRLISLVNDISLRNLIPNEVAKGFGFFHGKPASSFAPVAVTPDELGHAWRDGKVHLPMLASINGRLIGRPNAGLEMTFSFADLIAHAAKTRRLGAGTIIGSGTVSNKLDGGPGKSVDEGGAGYTCLAEVRVVETLFTGAPKTPFLRFGDRMKLEMRDATGASIFGAIDQVIVRYEGV